MSSPTPAVPPVLANLDRSEEEIFLVKLPADLASALRAKGKGLAQGKTRRVGTLSLDAAPARRPKTFTLTYEKDASTTRTYTIKAPPATEAVRVFAHERTEQISENNVGAAAGGAAFGVRRNPSKRPFQRPERVSFLGVVTCSGTALLETAKDEAAFSELAAKLAANSAARKREAKKRKLGRAGALSLGSAAAATAAQASVTMTNSKSSLENGAETRLKKTQGVREQSTVRLPKAKIETAIFNAFEALPPEANGGMKMPQIQAIATLRYQKLSWIKPVVAQLCDYHSEAGQLHARYTLKNF